MFDYHPGSDIFACVADPGWVTGHTYIVYGPLCNGATSLLFESIPTYPDYGTYMYVCVYVCMYVIITTYACMYVCMSV